MMDSRLAQLERIKQEMEQSGPRDGRRCVFGRGDTNARVMLIGEAPGKREDELGLPFVGSAGALLSAELEDAGLVERHCYITNLLKWRPPKNRDPQEWEVLAQWPWLMKQVAVIKPLLVVALGSFAARQILELPKARITDIHGTPYKRQFDDGQGERINIRVVPAIHPAAALRQGRMRDMLRADLRTAARMLAVD